MANNVNLFEKYGIKEVADVTFYRIEKKEEVYESQREFKTSSILKGAIKLQTVYEMDENGRGGENGVEAYVFTQAEVLTGEEFGEGEEAHTHEYTYGEQILMLFAKNQNLITKSGVRYNFASPDVLFEGFEFIDNYASAPGSEEKIVVLSFGGTIDATEVLEEINKLTSSYKAKAYDVVYKDYAELIVDDEMGYFNPNFVATDYDKKTQKISGTDLTGKIDDIVANAEMWGEDAHLSINDAIMALKQKKKSLDGGDSIETGVTSAKGGYEVGIGDFTVGEDDLAYNYTITGNVKSKYSLTAVLEALLSVSEATAVFTPDKDISGRENISNRAIYVDATSTALSASARIYILKNVNAKTLAKDTVGIFKFENKDLPGVGYYQDKIFAGTETLALVIIGGKGLIFKVDRYGEKVITKNAWVVDENGYPTKSQCEKVVKNGVIHTIDVTVEDETFEATCSLSDFKVKKTPKTVNRYVPVLFLDTLKVSTIEQTAEQTSATGGKGNAQLIIWDFGKEITLSLEDALYTPASMSAMLGSYDGNDFTKGVKDTKRIDRTEKCTANRSFIVPAGNSLGVPSEGDASAQAVYIDLNTMQPYQDGAPIAEGEVYLKWTRSIAYGDNSLGKMIEISADKFPGTYKVVGDTFARNKETGEDQRFQFVIPQAKMNTEQTITLEADGDPVVFNMSLQVLRPDNGVMVQFIQYDVVENTEENDGSTMVAGTENLNLLDGAEMFKVSGGIDDSTTFIGATEY